MDLLSTFLYFFPMLTVVLMGIGAALFIGGFIRKLMSSSTGSSHVMSASARQELAQPH